MDQLRISSIYVYDLEVYPNFTLAVFKRVSATSDGQVTIFTMADRDALARFLDRVEITLVGFNSFGFDDPLLKGILSGDLTTSEAVYDAAEAIIGRDRDDPTVKRLKTLKANWACVDLMQILGGNRTGSLKSHEVRLGLDNVQNLPIPPGTILDDDQKQKIIAYCVNDVDAAEALYFDALARIEVRHLVNGRYPSLDGSALRRSDASIAEEVMAGELAAKAAFDRRRYRSKSSFTFNPVHRIDASIGFKSFANQAALERLRSYDAFDAEQWAKRHSTSFIFEVGEHKITLGQGGLHTDIGPTLVRSPNILEFDVSSYYPSLLLKFDCVPEGLPRKWIEILRSLTKDRLDAKAIGNKPMADVYKIVINSIYGKLADPYSINRDLNLQLQVVLNGQLFLLMLMERFHSQGFRVIAANTDGLYVDAGDRPEDAFAVAAEWERNTGFKLESKKATIYAATSVNDYALYEPATGWFHKKGQFALGSRTRPSVIADAVLGHISSGSPVGDLVRGEDSILAFLYSGSAKGGALVTHRDIEVQKTNRWYKSVAGAPLIKVTINADGSEKVARLPNSDGAVIVNSLLDYDVPADIDYGHYVGAAENIVAELEAGVAKVATPTRRTKGAQRAQGHGLVVLPKGLRGRPKANVPDTYDVATVTKWRNTPAQDADWGAYEGYGCYTGREFGVLALDIDDPAIAIATGIFGVLGKRSAVAWHGGGKADDVLSCRRRGTVLFRYAGDQLATTGAKYLKNFGFEILYGKRVVQLGGYHQTGESYQWAGKPLPLPKALLDLLTWLTPDGYDSNDQSDECGITERLEHFLRVAAADEEYKAVGGELTVAVDKASRVHLKGICIGSELHSSGQREPTMKVSEWQGQLKVSCFHHSCDQARRDWEKRINDQIIVSKPIKLDPAGLIVSKEHQGVWDALQSDDKNKLILAPTGAGKTHNIVTHIVSRLILESTTPLIEGDVVEKYVIICSSKDQMRQIGERFGAVLDSSNINEHGIDLIEAEEGVSIGDARSRREVASSTRVAITHYTFVSRRQFGLEHYAFLKFIDEDTHVFIDEVDAFVASQTFSIQLGSRYKRMGSDGISNNVRLHKCGMHDGFNSCMNCIMRKYDGYKVTVDQFGVPVYQARYDFTDQDSNQQLEHIEIDQLELGRVMVGTTEVRMYQQAIDPGPMQFYGNKTIKDDGERKSSPTFRDMFEDQLQSAYLPTVHRPVIQYDGQEVDRQEVVARYGQKAGRTLAIPADERRRLKFPNRPCNVLTFTGIDRRPLAHMAKAKSVTMLTATATSMHERFLSEVLRGFSKSIIPASDERRMDKIIVVGMSKSIPVKQLADGNWKFGRMLRFRETQRAAEREFEKLKGSNVVPLFGFNSRKFMVNSEDLHKPHDILLTYSLGSLGRGIDLPSYDVVCVNAGIYKPLSAYVTDQPETVRDLIHEDRANTLRQNLGRVLRRVPGAEGRLTKIIVMEDLESQEEFDHISKTLEAMSIEPVATWWVPGYLAPETVCEWLTAICQNRVLPTNLPMGPEDLVTQAAELVASGYGKKEIKQKLRWSVTRKCLASDELNAVEGQIDDMLAKQDGEARRAKLRSPEKRAKMRERREVKIKTLIAAGKSDGQIRSNMKVYDARQGWHDDEAAWFEQLLRNERSALNAAS